MQARNLEDLCRTEMYDIEMCSECFDRSNLPNHDWFTEVCDPPHLLVWARMRGFPYWPAKVLGIASDTKIDVRFFGDHSRTNMSPVDCFLFSENPNTNLREEDTEALDECLKVIVRFNQSNFVF